jgi:flagellar basal-body rod modification protein FlgD
MDINPSDINKVVDGVYKDTSKSTEAAKKNNGNNNTLGKEAFLQLLVTQMQYQDPLNPQDDTQFISQLAQFSSLEQMQNLNEAFSNSSALGLVGRTVKITNADASGSTHDITGVVDYVTRDSKGKTYVTVNGNSYSADEVTEVYDETYLVSQKLPMVEAAEKEFDHSAPEDVVINLSLGKDDYEASGVAVMIGENQIDNQYLDYKDGTLTISKDAFKDLAAGKYATAFVFSNSVYTTVSDKVNITVKGIAQNDA